MSKISCTWGEFWGELLLARCHADRPERWTARQERARQVIEVAGLRPGARVLDLGCGDGLLDICLARLGCRVVAVDRLAGVLAAARREVVDETVEFRVADLRELEFGAAEFDAVLAFGLVGLLGRADEAALWRNIHRWLAPGAGLLIDGPDPPAAESGQATRQFADGVLTINWRYDPERRIQHIEPLFVTSDGQEIELLDPYDPLQPEHTGVIRRIQSVTELSAALGLGFTVAVADPAWRADVWLLLARPKVSQG